MKTLFSIHSYYLWNPPLICLLDVAGFHTIGGEAAMEEFDICMGANLTCMNDHLNRMGEFLHI